MFNQFPLTLSPVLQIKHTKKPGFLSWTWSSVSKGLRQSSPSCSRVHV